MPFLAQCTAFVLIETLIRTLAGHTDIQALQHTIELRIGLSEPSVLGEDLLLEFYDIDVVRQDQRWMIERSKTLLPSFMMNPIR